MKKILLAIPIVVTVGIILYLQFNDETLQSASPVSLETAAGDESTDSLSLQLDSAINEFDSLKPLLNQTIARIQYYESIRREVDLQISSYVHDKTGDNSELDLLKKKLSDANSEIARLNNELAGINKKGYSITRPNPKVDSTVEKPVITPDENSIIIELDGGGIISAANLNIYLIPYDRKSEVRRFMKYEASCSADLNGTHIASNYQGLYFFNSVAPGKYLVKICTYYGNYKLVNKKSGKQNIKMEIAPPLQ